jgi:hypothetical protein
MADSGFPFEISDHAREVLQERGIELAWVTRVIRLPIRTHPDLLDPNALHALAKIPEFGDRVLRVIYNPTVQPWRIVTAFFDRRMKGRL